MAKICVVDERKADIKVFRVDRENKADLLVFVVDRESRADGDEFWYMEERDNKATRLLRG